MEKYAQLDEEIRENGGKGFSLADATVFMAAVKTAAPGQPAPDADLAEHGAQVAAGEEATPEEALAATAAGTPDTSGHLEGEFAVPIEQVVSTIAQIVSNGMRQHGAYAYYGEIMRGLGRGELAELFDDQGEDEVKELKYFLRRMGVLQPGGVPIPVVPTPVPSSDPEDALRFLIAGEQAAIVLFKTLHAMLGQNPMKYTLEQLMSDAQGHLDHLWQYMPAAQGGEKAAAKVAAALHLVKTAVRGEPPLDSPREVVIPRVKKAAPQQPTPSKDATVVPAPGSEPVEAHLGRESMLQHAQALNENADLKERLDQMATQLHQAETQIGALQAETQSTQAQMQTVQQMADMATQQAQLSTEEAAMQTENAAAQADAKMRLSMRIQQFRQQLADIVSQDPVGEEGAGFGEQAGPGAPVTSAQQQQAADAQMADTGGDAKKPTSKSAPKTAGASPFV